MKLTVVIPVYNERQTISSVLLAVTAALPEVEKEIIIVDDGSKDGTREWLRQNLAAANGRYAKAVPDRGNLQLHPADGINEAGATFRVIEHTHNTGKGGAVRTGLAVATGDVVVLQDADLEYDPRDWERMLPLITERRVADVVYGSRFYGQPHRSLFYHHYLGNRLISFLFNMIYNQTLSDIEVCYKMFRHEVLDGVVLTSNDFGIEVEISAAIARAALADLRNRHFIFRPNLSGREEDQLERRYEGLVVPDPLPDVSHSWQDGLGRRLVGRAVNDVVPTGLGEAGRGGGRRPRSR